MIYRWRLETQPDGLILHSKMCGINSVTDPDVYPGSWILDPIFSIPDFGSGVDKIPDPDPHQRSIFNPKN